MHPIGRKTKTPQKGKKIKGKPYKTKRDRAAQTNKYALTMHLKPASLASSRTLSRSSFHRDSE